MSQSDSIPFFSIVIPTFNRSELLLKTIYSVIQQSCKFYEIIIVDDGSTDDTAVKIKELQKENSLLKYLYQPNKERGAARNIGFNQSSAQYVVFIDSDDIMHPNHLQILFETIKSNNYPDFLTTYFDFFNEKGTRKKAGIMQFKEGYYDYKVFLEGNPVACNICVKKNLENYFPFEESREYSVKEDWMYLVVNLFFHKIYIIPQVTITMFDHSKRSMRTEDNIYQKTILAAEWIKQQIQLTSVENKKLTAHVNYFSAIHSYIENKNTEAKKYLNKAIQLNGMKKIYFILYIKLILGNNLMIYLRGKK